MKCISAIYEIEWNNEVSSNNNFPFQVLQNVIWKNFKTNNLQNHIVKYCVIKEWSLGHFIYLPITTFIDKMLIILKNTGHSVQMYDL